MLKERIHSSGRWIALEHPTTARDQTAQDRGHLARV